HNDTTISDIGTIEFEGTGIAVNGEVRSADQSYVAEIEAYLDGKLVESFKMPTAYHNRRLDIFWTYELPKGKHTLEFKWLNPAEGVSIRCPNHIIYSDQPATDNHQ
ncbi:MAG: ADP-ribosylglycohydrolase family protein, partial [Muribaculaceae bacterium]|nr:ADP-ribosylglycohydrolase family protein [Muribaculaceae bacterium]